MSASVKNRPAAKPAKAGKAVQPARKQRLTAAGLLRIIEADAPLPGRLPKNPVLVARGSRGV